MSREGIEPSTRRLRGPVDSGYLIFAWYMIDFYIEECQAQLSRANSWYRPTYVKTRRHALPHLNLWPPGPVSGQPGKVAKELH